MALREDLLKLAGEMAAAAPGTLRLAYNEEDARAVTHVEAAHFLKVDGHRHGRDIELYALMATVQGDWNAIIEFAGEIVLPLKSTAPDAYAVGVAGLKEFGRTHLDADRITDWDAVFDEPASAPTP